VEAIPQAGEGATCRELGEEPMAGFTVGDAIDVSALPKTEPLLGGEGRLQVPLVGIGSVAYRRDYARSTFFDTQTNQGCSEVLFVDGSIYCVPESFTQETYARVFADDTCSGPRLFPRSNYVCTPESEGVVMNVPGCTTTAAEVFSVAPFESETGYELSTDGQCTSFLVSSKSPYYVTTGSIDPSERFAELEAVIVE
jgi:hypothetical protein